MLGETWSCPPLRLASGVLTSGTGWLQRKFRENTRSQRCKQSLDLSHKLDLNFRSSWNYVGQWEFGTVQKLSHTHIQPSPPTSSRGGSPVGSEMHLLGKSCLVSYHLLPTYSLSHFPILLLVVHSTQFFLDSICQIPVSQSIPIYFPDTGSN